MGRCSQSSVGLLARLLLLAGQWVAAAGVVHAQAPIPGYPDSIEAFDPREVAMLPRYCTYTHYFRAKLPDGSNSTETERWRNLMGPNNFEHVHHYCFAMMKTNRAVLLARSSEARTFYLNDSLKEFDYILDRVSPEFVLLPEILTKKAENLFLLGRGPVAAIQLRRAIQLKPDYWPPYAKLADHYKDVGDVAQARETLESGLAANPGAAALTRRLDALGTAHQR